MIKNNFISDQEILLKIGKNDIEAFKILYDRYTPLLFPIIKTIVKDDETAESVLRDTFLIVWRWAEEFDFVVNNVFTWMILLTRNKAIDTLKRKRGDANLPEYSDEYEILNILPQLSLMNESLEREYISRQIDEISQIVKNLRDDKQNLFHLVFFEGLNDRRIAEKMRMPVATVKPQIQSLMGILLDKIIK